MAITAQLVKELRERSGCGMMDCKKALGETDGDFEKAFDYLRKKGLTAGAKKAGRIAAEGVVQSYIHGGGKIGVLVEVNCESDFVARNEAFQTFCKDVAMHIAASRPLYVSRDEVSAAEIAREKEVLEAQANEGGGNKPAAVIEKMVEGRLSKFFKEICLLEQPFVKDPELTIEQLLNQMIATIGEKITIRRFARLEMGEGIEKKSEDYGAEVMAAMNA